jgi:hypothetical protein
MASLPGGPHGDGSLHPACIQPGLVASQELWLPYLEDLTGLEVCARPEPRGLQTAEAVVWPPV